MSESSFTSFTKERAGWLSGEVEILPGITGNTRGGTGYTALHGDPLLWNYLTAGE